MLMFADYIAIIAQDEMNLKKALESLDDILTLILLTWRIC
jgi:hypothetical protein